MIELEIDVVGGVKRDDIEKLNVLPLGVVELKLFYKVTTGYILIHGNTEFKNAPDDSLVHVLVLVGINGE